MDLAAVMDEVAARLITITGLRVFAYPPDSVVPPAAIVSYPDEIEPHGTYARGMAKIRLPVVVVVGKVTDRGTRALIAGYVATSGAASVVAVLESTATPYVAFDTLTVASVEFDVVQIAENTYLAALFDLEIAGDGS